jgi:hypothetical protein
MAQDGHHKEQDGRISSDLEHAISGLAWDGADLKHVLTLSAVGKKVIGKWNNNN